MITSQRFAGIHALFSGPEAATPVLFLHGNLSSSTFWKQTMLSLPPQYRGIAPDLRGFGLSNGRTIDATHGFGDWVQDVLALKAALQIKSYHVAGHSLGGGVVFALIAEDSQNIISATLVAPASPYGYGGTKDVDGTPCWPDCAGSGAGGANPFFTRLLAAGDRTTADPDSSPRAVMNKFYWNPQFHPAPLIEEELLSSVLATKVGPSHYPGDWVRSANWPGFAPGIKGPLNAMSPKYVKNTARRFVEAEPKPPVLWMHGSADQIVSDFSLFDFGTLGKFGMVPGWPGDFIFPSQPMVGQLRNVLGQYRNRGGEYTEKVMDGAGHTPYLERPDEFLRSFLSHLALGKSH
jgi:pimeloyl-ACP methyl ester carboxylesterase